MSDKKLSAKEQAVIDAGVLFGINMLKLVPRDDKLSQEAHITGVLIAFWGALWGTFGTEYARGFIEAQLRGMEPDVPSERFTEPRIQ
jgi:hypothetical protein